MPDAGNTFAADLVIDEALSINFEGGAASFIDGLAADLSDLRVFNADGSVELAWGKKQFSQVSGNRKLVLGLGVPSTAALSASADTTYWLYRGCTGGPFESKAGVVPTADGWVRYWPLEEASGTAYDWTTNAGHLTPSGGATQGSAGAVGKAVEFDGVNGKLSCAGQSTGSTFSIGMWIKPQAGDGYATLLTMGDSRGIYFLSAVRKVDFVGYSETTSSALTYGVWAHVVVVMTPSGVSIYKNGVLDASSSDSRAFTADSLGDNVGGETYKGMMDEVLWSNVARSAKWWLAYYNMTSDNAMFWTVGDEVLAGGAQIVFGAWESQSDEPRFASASNRPRFASGSDEPRFTSEAKY
jgi:hypothetical protein